MTSIKDVALAAGVSVGTVSKVFDKTGTIAAVTRKRVAQIAHALNFRLKAWAQSLHSRLSGLIGLVSNDSFGRFTMSNMEGLQAVLATEGMGVFMCNATDDPDRKRRHVEQLLSKQIDGLIVTSRRSDHRPAMQPAGLGIPVIHVFAHSDEPDALPLLPDDEGGARMAVEHLLDLGRRRIAHITGPARFEAVRLPVAGYRAALHDAALPVLHGPWSEAWGREAGRKVPQDAALIGFDNRGVIAEACRPPLSSVDICLKDLGAEAGRRMLAMIAGETFHGLQRLPCKLIPRASAP